MNDEEFVRAFEDCTFSPFRHEDHVRLAWIYLRESALSEAMMRFRDSLKIYAASLGKLDKYHETITFGFILLIHDRMKRGDMNGWGEFALANPDLLDWKKSILQTLYRRETLDSPLARRTFVMPDAN